MPWDSIVCRGRTARTRLREATEETPLPQTSGRELALRDTDFLDDAVAHLQDPAGPPPRKDIPGVRPDPEGPPEPKAPRRAGQPRAGTDAAQVVELVGGQNQDDAP